MGSCAHEEKGHWSEWAENGHGGVSRCLAAGTRPLPPPPDPNPQRGQGPGAGQGLCELDTEATGSRPQSHKSGGHTQHRVSSSSNSRGGRGGPPDALPEKGRAPRTAAQNCTPERPRLVGRRRLKGGRRAPLDFQPAAPAWRDVAPSGHLCTLASGPSSTTTDLCPFTSHHHQVLAPRQEAGAGGGASARSGGPCWPGGQAAPKETAEHRGPEKRFNQESAQEESGEFSIGREEGSPGQAPQGAGHALEGRGRVINGPVT